MSLSVDDPKKYLTFCGLRNHAELRGRLVCNYRVMVYTIRCMHTFMFFAAIFAKGNKYVQLDKGWSGGAKVLSKLPVPGRPTNLDNSRARAYCACSRCGWGLFGLFSHLYRFSFLSPSLWETARYRLKYCLKGTLSPKQPTNHPTGHRKETGATLPFLNKIYFSSFKS